MGSTKISWQLSFFVQASMVRIYDNVIAYFQLLLDSQMSRNRIVWIVLLFPLFFLAQSGENEMKTILLCLLSMFIFTFHAFKRLKFSHSSVRQKITYY